MTKLPEGMAIPGPWTSIEEVRAHHRNRRVDWFDAGPYFGTRVETGMLEGRLFLTSEQFEPSEGEPWERRWTVRAVHDDGWIETVGPFYELTSAEAVELARALVDERRGQ